MNTIYRLGLALVFMGLVSGCSTPKVIETIKLSDRDLSCDSLKDEFDDFLESTKNEIVETKEVMEKRTDEIEEATNARHKEIGEQYEDFLVSAKENAEKSIEQITESYLKKD